MQRLFLGVELGATKIQLAIGNDRGELLDMIRSSVVLEDGAKGILFRMERDIPKLIGKGRGLSGEIKAVGVGFGGIVETATGKVLGSVQVKGWNNFLLKNWLEEHFGLPTVVLNDTVAGGYGEYIAGTGQGTRNFFYTNIGSGIGGVFILDGRYFDGQGYGAAYFGHTYVPDWTSALPGAREKVENLCSGWAIERRLRSPGYVPKDSRLMLLCGGRVEELTCSILLEAAKADDPFAMREIAVTAESFGTGLANVVNLIGPDCISIGGGVSNMGELLLQPIRRTVDRLAFISAQGRYRIVQCKSGDAAVPLGAILYAAKALD